MDRAHLDASLQQLKHELELLKARGNNNSINISSDGIIVVVVGLVAICCLFAGLAMSFVSWQHAEILQRKTDMIEAKQILAERRLSKLEETKP